MRGLLRIALCACVSLAGLSVRAAEPEEIALAERIAALADRYGNVATAAPYKQALYEAASRLAEKEVRFRRQRYRAAEASADIESMLQTLQEWQRLEPSNLFVQMRRVDVYVGRLQTADERLKYVKGIADSEKVDAQVRSHAAVHMARLQFEQSRTQQAMESLRRALVLNGLNLEALELQWQQAYEGSTPVQRLTILLSMLRADPTSIQSVLAVAQELADAGMVQPSLPWYGHASGMARPLGGLGTRAAKDYAAQLLIAGQDRAAAELSSRMLEANTSDPAAWFLTLMAERNVTDRIELVKKNALIGLVNRLAEVRKALGVVSAATQPLGSDGTTIPDLAGDRELVAKADPPLQAAYVEALADLAWLILYHEVQADAGPVLETLRSVAGDDKALLARLDGWRLLRAGKLEEARAALAGIVDQDPLSAIAMVRILKQDPATVTGATDLARQTLRNYPSRLLGVYVQAELASLAGELPADPGIDLLHDTLDRFPRELLKLSSAPHEFVSMRLQPRQVGHDYAEPILMEVELRNTQQVPVVVGPTGMVRDLWVDVQSRGLLSLRASGVSFEKTDGPVLLQPGAATRWTVRIDRGALAEAMERAVQQSLQLNVYALTNAVPTVAGVVPGPAGINGMMAQMLERRPASLLGDAAIRRAWAVIDGTDPVAKLRLVDVITAYLKLVRDPESAEDVKGMDPECQEMLRRLAKDSSAPVRAWAKYRMAQLMVEPGDKVGADLAAEPIWYARLLGAAAAMETGPEQRAALLEKMSRDADQTVGKLVAAIPAAMESARPATQDDALE